MSVRIMNLCTRWTGVDNSTLPQIYPWKEHPGAFWLGSWAVPISAVEESLLPLSEVEPKIIDSHTTDGANCLKDVAWYRVEAFGFQFM